MKLNIWEKLAIIIGVAGSLFLMYLLFTKERGLAYVGILLANLFWGMGLGAIISGIKEGRKDAAA